MKKLISQPDKQMDFDYVVVPVLTTISIGPNEVVKVEVPYENIWDITSISILPTPDMPSKGRVLVYAKPCNVDNAEKIVIAPLRIGEMEVITVDYTIDGFTPMEFETSGADVTVVISGNIQTVSELVITRREK